MKDLDPIVRALRDERLSRGLSLVALSEKTGIPASMIGRWELGFHRPLVGSVHQWADGLGLDLKLRRRQ